MATPRQKDEMDTTTEAIGTMILLPDEKTSLSTQIIMNYFTSDGPTKAIDNTFGDNKQDKTILTEEYRPIRYTYPMVQPVKMQGLNRPEGPKLTTILSENCYADSMNSLTWKLLRILEEMWTLKVAFALLVVILSLAHCIWMWNTVELSALDLEFWE